MSDTDDKQQDKGVCRVLKNVIKKREYPEFNSI